MKSHDSAPANAEVNSTLSRKKKIGVYILSTLAIGSGATLSAGEYYAGQPLVFFNHAYDSFAYHGEDPLPEHTMQVINQLADEPTGADYIEYSIQSDKAVPQTDRDGDGMIEFGSDDDLRPGEKSKQRLYFEFAQRESVKYGLHLVDPIRYEERIDQANTSSALSNILQEYGNELGVSIVLHNDRDLRDIGTGITPLKRTGFEYNQELINGVKTLIGSMSFSPKELYEFADIREIRIVESFEEVENTVIGNFTPAGEAMPMTGMIYLPKDYLLRGNYDLIMHEIAHRMDYRMNSNSTFGMKRDKEFLALNDDAFVYGAEGSGDSSDMATAYSATNPIEDKATLMESMLNGISASYLDHDNDIIRDKYRLLLARLEHYIPGFGQYMLSIVPHESDYYEQMNEKLYQ